jgi:PleD family two-component response regulator
MDRPQHQEGFEAAPLLDVRMTRSIGLAQYKPHEYMKVFVHRLDHLMHQEKKNGKNRICSES